MIIGLVGKSGSGKDTVAGMISGAQRMSFADPLKEFCAEVFGWPRDVLWGPSMLRNMEDPRYIRPDGTPLTPRFALQTLGTEWGRGCCENIWASAGMRRAQRAIDAGETDVVVFTDCRFINEARAIREAGGEVWRVVRPESGLAGVLGQHASEAEQDSPPMTELITRVIPNSGTIDDLRHIVSRVLEALVPE